MSKTYTFSEDSYHDKKVTIVTVTEKTMTEKRTTITPSTYRRFARVANSGKYPMQIIEDKDDFGWYIYKPDRAWLYSV